MMNTYTDAQQTQMERGGCRDARCVTVRGWEVGVSTHVRDMSWVVEPVLPTNKVVARYYTSPRQNESIGAQGSCTLTTQGASVEKVGTSHAKLSSAPAAVVVRLSLIFPGSGSNHGSHGELC